LEINVNDIDYTTEDLADALRDADLGRAYGEVYRLKIACMRDDRVSQESFADLVSALEIILSRLSGGGNSCAVHRSHTMPSDERLLRLPAVIDRTSLSKSTIERLEAIGDFPRRRQAAPHSVGWLSTELEVWFANLPTAPARFANLPTAPASLFSEMDEAAPTKVQ
jgi:prophage regulatory protein